MSLLKDLHKRQSHLQLVTVLLEPHIQKMTQPLCDGDFTKGTEFTADTMVDENHKSTTAPTP